MTCWRFHSHTRHVLFCRTNATVTSPTLVRSTTLLTNPPPIHYYYDMSTTTTTTTTTTVAASATLSPVFPPRHVAVGHFFFSCTGFLGCWRCMTFLYWHSLRTMIFIRVHGVLCREQTRWSNLCTQESDFVRRSEHMLSFWAGAPCGESWKVYDHRYVATVGTAEIRHFIPLK